MEALPGVLAGLAAAAGWATASHLFARAIERARGAIGAPTANLFKNALALVALAVVGRALGAGYPGDGRVVWLLVSGVTGFAIGDALYFAAFARCGVQVAAICGNLIPPVAALLAWWVLDEALPPVALVGMAVSLAGIALVVLDRRSGRLAVDPRTRWTGIGFAVANAVLQAIAILAGRVGFAETDLLPGTVLRLVGGVGGALLMAAVWGGRSGLRGAGRELATLTAPLARPSVARVLIVGAMVGAVLNLPLHSLAIGSLSPGVSSILLATTPLWTLPIGLRLGERYGWRTAVGTVAAFVGVGLVIAGTA